MKLTTLNIRSSQINVFAQTTDHNLLRWTAMAIDVNADFAQSLMQCSGDAPVYLTDSIYLERHNPDITQVPMNTHIVLWDGINSYFELLQKQRAFASRQDLKFFVVGWLEGAMLSENMHIVPLYPNVVAENVKAWSDVLSFHKGFYVPYWYRFLTTLLTHTRYFKNWFSDSKKHCELSRGGKLVFCGLVTPTAHNVQAFFIGADLPTLQKVCAKLLTLEYVSPVDVVNEVVRDVIVAIKAERIGSVSEMACVYSILNVLHRIKTLSVLYQLNSDIFVNEVRNSRRFDPYDSFFYRNNLYLDFGSTRGPDAIYPRTLDLCMKNKPYISLRFLSAKLTIAQYIAELSYDGFLLGCESDAKSAHQLHQQMFRRGHIV
jgi:hypothetical protein